jgi:hypothetical protein
MKYYVYTYDYNCLYAYGVTTHCNILQLIIISIHIQKSSHIKNVVLNFICLEVLQISPFLSVVEVLGLKQLINSHGKLNYRK